MRPIWANFYEKWGKRAPELGQKNSIIYFARSFENKFQGCVNFTQRQGTMGLASNLAVSGSADANLQLWNSSAVLSDSLISDGFKIGTQLSAGRCLCCFKPAIVSSPACNSFF